MKIYTNEMIKKKLEKRKKINKIVKIIIYPIMFFIIFCALTILYQKIIKREENVNLLGYRLYIVSSGSMQPNLEIGDIVVAKETNEENINNNDIITFVDESGNTITHRVIDTIIKDGKKYYQTRGDNNNSNDVGLVAIENIKGKYAFKIENVGTIISQIITPTGLMLSILILSVGYMNASKKADRKIARHYIRERYKKQNKIKEV